ncbi:MAG: MFS transporter [Clostridiales bacterium]|nr:MFS transporter [Clostridiales bacterium]
MGEEGEGRVLPPRVRWGRLEPWRQNLYVLWFGSLVVSLSFSLVMPFLPLYLVEELGLKTDPSLWSGIVLAGAFLGTAVMSPVWGALADRFGQRAMLLRSGFSLAFIYVAMGLSATPLQLAIWRVLFGAMSGFIPAATALVASNTPTPYLGIALGSLSTGTAAGGVLGPLFGGAVAQWLGYRGAFYAAGFGLLLGAILAFFLVGERVPPFRGSSWRRFLPELWELFQRPSLRESYILIFFQQTAMMVAAPVLPLIIADHAPHASSLLVGLIYALAGVAQVMGGPVTARLAGRTGYRRLLTFSFLATAFLMLPQASSSLALLGGSRFIFGFPLVWGTVALTYLVTRAAPEGQRGQVFGLVNSINSLASMAGSLVGGLLGHVLGWNAAIYGSALLFLVGALLSWQFTRTGSLRE